MPQFKLRGERIMAGIKFSALPVLKFGRGATDPSVTITDSGQIRFNKLASAVFGDKGRVFVDFDPKTRVMSFQGVSGLPKNLKEKGWTEEDLPALKAGNEKNPGIKYILAGGLLTHKESGIGYDYKVAGNQNFKPTMNAEKAMVSFVVPKETPTAKPKAKRTKKTAAPATGAAAATVEEDISLD
jgi:hypothetical protein